MKQHVYACGTGIGEKTMEFVLYEQKGAYAIITINREKALNALNSTVLDRNLLWPERTSER